MEEQSQGSGIILSEDGYIVTNQHVIDGATSVKVVLNDGSEYNASVVGEDEKTDLAVLKIEATGLTPAEFGNSDQMQIGEQVIAVGNPGGLELAGSVTVGYVSAVNRQSPHLTVVPLTASRPMQRSTQVTRAVLWSTPMVRLSVLTRRRLQQQNMKVLVLQSPSMRHSQSSTT